MNDFERLAQSSMEYAESPSARAEVVACFEQPAVVTPFEMLACAVTPCVRGCTVAR